MALDPGACGLLPWRCMVPGQRRRAGDCACVPHLRAGQERVEPSLLSQLPLRPVGAWPGGRREFSVTVVMPRVGDFGVVHGPVTPALSAPAPREGDVQASCPGRWGPNRRTERELSVLESRVYVHRVASHGPRSTGAVGTWGQLSFLAISAVRNSRAFVSCAGRWCESSGLLFARLTVLGDQWPGHTCVRVNHGFF